MTCMTYHFILIHQMLKDYNKTDIMYYLYYRHYIHFSYLIIKIS